MSTLTPTLPSPVEKEQALMVSRSLAAFMSHGPGKVKLIEDEDMSTAVELPQAAVQLLFEILEQMAMGHAIAVIPFHAEITTSQAAELMNVSRPFLIKLLEQGALPFRKVGAHRRIKFEDLMQYLEQEKRRQEKILTKLTEEAEEMGFYD